MRFYPQFSEHQVCYELPMCRGFAYLAGAKESNPMLQRDGAGYIAQEMDRIN